MNATLILISVGGLVLHFVTRWGEHWRTSGKCGPVTYAMQDPPGWIAAAVGACVCMLMLQNLPAMLGIPGDVGESGLMQAAAFTAGYMGSSVAAKLPAIFTGKGVR
jgi:hypothetical protein